MAKIILKSPYIKPNSKNKIEKFIKYIATRDGVEKVNSNEHLLPVAKYQNDLIQTLVFKYPDSKELHEYQDYEYKKTRKNADELIKSIIDTHPQTLGNREKYISYISQRPRVEKLSNHGLFTDDGIPVVLSEVEKEISETQSNIWTHVISLKREDANRLGYDNVNSWINLLRANRNIFASNMNISPENFRWYASFHQESYHPHVHLVAYSIKKNEAYLSRKGIENIKLELSKTIFRQDLISIYNQKDIYRKSLKDSSRDIIENMINDINKNSNQNDKISQLLLTLNKRLLNTKSKKVYGYLKPDLKNIINQILDEFSQDERIKTLYDLWYNQKEETIKIYTDFLPKRVPLVENKEFKSIKNIIINEAMKINLEEKIDETIQNVTSTRKLNIPTPEDNDKADRTIDNSTDNSTDNSINNSKEDTTSEIFDNKTITCIHTNQNSNIKLDTSTLNLIKNIAKIIEDKIYDEELNFIKTEEKLQRKINEKKYNLGLH